MSFTVKEAKNFLISTPPPWIISLRNNLFLRECWLLKDGEMSFKLSRKMSWSSHGKCLTANLVTSLAKKMSAGTTINLNAWIKGASSCATGATGASIRDSSFLNELGKIRRSLSGLFRCRQFLFKPVRYFLAWPAVLGHDLSMQNGAERCQLHAPRWTWLPCGLMWWRWEWENKNEGWNSGKTMSAWDDLS